MADVGKKTGKKTQAGRDVYKTPEGELVSEKSTTFKYKGKWVNVPTIFDGKSYDEETLLLMLEADIIKPTSIHNSLKEATEAARKRSDSLKFNEGGMAEEPRFDEEELKEIARLQSDPTSEHYYNDPDETFMSKVRRKLEPYGEEFKGFVEYLFSPSKHFGTGQYNEGGVADQTDKAFGGAYSRRPGFRSFSEAKGQVSEDELMAGVENAASFLIPFYDSGVNISNVVEEYMKPEGERDYDYIKGQFTEAGQSAALEAGLLLMGGVVGKYGAKGVKALSDKVKQYEIDPSAMSAFGVGAIKKKAPVGRSADVAEAERLLDNPEALGNWQKTEGGKGQRQKNPEASEQAAEALYQGEITSKEARKIIEDAIPSPELYTSSNMPEMPTVTEVVGSLGKKAGKYGILGVKGFDLKAGQEISSRLDIPAYNNYDKWVVSIHDGTKDAGAVVGFGQAIRLKNIRFGSKAKESLDIARRKVLKEADPEKGTPEKRMGKSTIARIFGEYVPEDPYKLQEEARRLLADPDSGWTQVGMNPYRKSAFYDKATGKPVFEADEVIQVGPLVLAKNVKKATISQMKEMGVRTKDDKIRVFNEGGAAMNMQKQMSLFEYGGIADDGMKKDPVSGNDIPPGSLAKEVRDDIPAMLSEGEYVVPADVLRYYGVNFFEGLRGKAKQGLQSMEQNGRIGGEPLTPQQIQQNMSGAPQAGQPAPMPVQANAGILTMPDEYTQQSQQLGGGGFNPEDWATVGGSTFNQPSQQDSVTTFKTFVNAETNQKRVLEYVNGKLKNPGDEQYTVPPYYEFGSSALKKAQQATQQPTGGDDGGSTPPPTTPTSDNSIENWGQDIDWTDPLAFAKTLEVSKLEKLGGIGTALAGAALGPAGMLGAGVAQTAMGLGKISDLRAAAIIARAQGMEDQAKQIDDAVKDYISQSNNAVQFLEDIVADGNKKAETTMNRLGLLFDKDKKGNYIFKDTEANKKRTTLLTGDDDDPPLFTLAEAAKEADKDVDTQVTLDDSGNVSEVTTTGGTAEQQQTMQDYVTSAAAGNKGGLMTKAKKKK